MKPFYFLPLLALVYGELTIDIDTNVHPFIDVRGFLPKNVISDVERATFGIEDAALKKAVAKYTNDGLQPDFVYVKKVGDKESKDFPAWSEVKTNIKPVYIDLKPEPVCKPVAKTTKTVLNVTADWKIEGKLSVADKITHIIYYGDQNFTTASKKWGEDFNVTATMELVPLSATSTLQECTLTVPVKYQATLVGDVAVDYTKPRLLHHYYVYDMANVKTAGLKDEVVNTETITVTYYKYT